MMLGEMFGDEARAGMFQDDDDSRGSAWAEESMDAGDSRLSLSHPFGITAKNDDEDDEEEDDIDEEQNMEETETRDDYDDDDDDDDDGDMIDIDEES